MATAKKLPSGAYRVRVYIGKGDDGKPKYKSFTGSDKRKIEREAAAYADEHREAKKTVLFGDVARRYIDSKQNILSPTTIDGYKDILKIHFNKELSSIPIDNITDNVLQCFINELSATLSPKTVRNVCSLATAVIYSHNPSKRYNITLPKKQKHFKDLTEPELVLKAVKNTEIELAVLLALWLSLRMSEVRGLRYCDIKNGILTINNVLVSTKNGDVLKNHAKTVDSKRRLVIPDYIMSLIPHGKNATDYLVPLSVNQIDRRFYKALEDAGLPHMRFHDLRHLNASVMLLLGVPDKYAMERGGWSTPNVLKSVYQHTFSQERKLTDEKIDAYFNSMCREI